MKKLTVRLMISVLIVSLFVPTQFVFSQNEAEDQSTATKEGAGFGALFGAGIGALVSGDKAKGAAIGGLVGGLFGGLVGHVIAKKKNEQITAEDDLDVIIVTLENRNDELAKTIETVQAEIAKYDGEVNALKVSYQSGSVTQEVLNKKSNELQSKIEELTVEVDFQKESLRVGLEQFDSLQGQADADQTKIAKLEKANSGLLANLNILEKELYQVAQLKTDLNGIEG